MIEVIGNERISKNRLAVQNLGSLNACLSALGEVANKKTPSPIPLVAECFAVRRLEPVMGIETDTLTYDQPIGHTPSAKYTIQSTAPFLPSPVAALAG